MPRWPTSKQRSAGRGSRDGALTERVFDVVEEVGRLFRAHGANLARYESDPGSAMVVGSWESKPGTNVDEGHRVLLTARRRSRWCVGRAGPPASTPSPDGGHDGRAIRARHSVRGGGAGRRRRSTLGRRCRHERRSRGVRRERRGTAGQVRESRRRGDRKRGGARAAHRVARARASSAPGTRSVYGSSATFTTARSSGWWRCPGAPARAVAARRRSRGSTGAARVGLEELALALEELRELARGIHPAILTNRGLSAAIEALAARLPLRSSWGASARTGFRPPSKRPRTT